MTCQFDAEFSIQPICPIRTGFRVFLMAVSKVPALIAMISGAASGSWAMGEPHSEQKMRWTALPEEPTPAQLFVGPFTVSLALGTTATKAVIGKGWLAQTDGNQRRGKKEITVGGATLTLAVIAVVVPDKSGLVDVNRVGDSFAETVAGERHDDDGDLDDSGLISSQGAH